ncbi:MAG TPA: 2-C-methyl-D-erythritol 2,4-cyclodiphosphate synthase [Candidatus Eisenbacteria bacterium]|nr:2-C-methyl-D-erythritol 2,4-cyclodiphosphate synthase [Candidatus Eisenbacteria bacterium]
MGQRVGLGYDVHPFGHGRALILGGVRVESHRGLVGHSDADAVCHAVADAILGALALGDLGKHFPDTEGRWRGASSIGILEQVVAMAAERRASVVNADVTVVLEEPRLAPYVDAMRERLGQALGTGPERVSVKATRPEGLGALGQGHGLAALAVVLLETK